MLCPLRAKRRSDALALALSISPTEQFFLSFPFQTLGRGHCFWEIYQAYLDQIYLMQIETSIGMEASVSPLPWPEFLKLLAHEIRWKILPLLARSAYRVQELVTENQKT